MIPVDHDQPESGPNLGITHSELMSWFDSIGIDLTYDHGGLPVDGRWQITGTTNEPTMLVQMVGQRDDPSKSRPLSEVSISVAMPYVGEEQRISTGIVLADMARFVIPEWPNAAVEIFQWMRLDQHHASRHGRDVGVFRADASDGSVITLIIRP